MPRAAERRRRYSYRDLLELKVIKTLLDAGIRLESVRSAFDYLRSQLGEDIASAQLVISGNTAVLVRDGESSSTSSNRGQGVLSILPLGGVQREVDAAIVELRPGVVAPGPGRTAYGRLTATS